MSSMTENEFITRVAAICKQLTGWGITTPEAAVGGIKFIDPELWNDLYWGPYTSGVVRSVFSAPENVALFAREYAKDQLLNEDSDLTVEEERDIVLDNPEETI